MRPASLASTFRAGQRLDQRQLDRRLDQQAISGIDHRCALDYPTLTVTKYRAENWLCGCHAHTGWRSDQKSDDSENLKGQKGGPNRAQPQAAD
jgi:hypothetical protein